MLKRIPARMFRLAAIAGVFVAMAVAPAGASAAGLIPIGDKFTLTSQSVTFSFNNGPTGTCTLNGGGGTVTGSPVPLTTRPTFSACSVLGTPISFFTYGTWSLEFPGGMAADLKIPAEGFKTGYPGCESLNSAPITIKGTWKNGTFPPATTKSTLTTTPFSVPVKGPISNCGQVTFGGATFTVSNTTRPELPIYLNP